MDAKLSSKMSASGLDARELAIAKDLAWPPDNPRGLRPHRSSMCVRKCTGRRLRTRSREFIPDRRIAFILRLQSGKSDLSWETYWHVRCSDPDLVHTCLPWSATSSTSQRTDLPAPDGPISTNRDPRGRIKSSGPTRTW